MGIYDRIVTGRDKPCTSLYKVTYKSTSKWLGFFNQAVTDHNYMNQKGFDKVFGDLVSGLPACTKENNNVRLQLMPSRCKISPARIPSYVEAILIKIRCLSIPTAA